MGSRDEGIVVSTQLDEIVWDLVEISLMTEYSLDLLARVFLDGVVDKSVRNYVHTLAVE
jgi:hypothetical protein